MEARRLSNRQVRKYVEQCFPFSNSNKTLYGDWKGKLFVVWSYGSHWPLFIYDPASEKWFENATSSSRTTSRHRSQARPWRDANGQEIETLDRDIHWMRNCIDTKGAGIEQELLLSSLPLC